MTTRSGIIDIDCERNLASCAECGFPGALDNEEFTCAFCGMDFHFIQPIGPLTDDDKAAILAIAHATGLQVLT